MSSFSSHLALRPPCGHQPGPGHRACRPSAPETPGNAHPRSVAAGPEVTGYDLVPPSQLSKLSAMATDPNTSSSRASERGCKETKYFTDSNQPPKRPRRPNYGAAAHNCHSNAIHPIAHSHNRVQLRPGCRSGACGWSSSSSSSTSMMCGRSWRAQSPRVLTLGPASSLQLMPRRRLLSLRRL